MIFIQTKLKRNHLYLSILILTYGSLLGVEPQQVKKGEFNFGRHTVTSFQFEASSVMGEKNSPINLFDSNLDTYWFSEKTELDEWVLIDFGTKRLFNYFEIEIPTYKGKRAVPEYQVQVLHRGNWKTIFINKYPQFSNRNFLGSVDASMIRVYMPKKSKESYVVNNIKIQLNNTLINGVDSRLQKFLFPVKDGVLSEDPSTLPGSPRKYRNGIHKGLDIFYKMIRGKKSPLSRKDKILSVLDGTVVRADHKYIQMTKKEYEDITSYNQNNKVTYVDKDFGGRQVWIDHKNGIMSSYNHLSAISEGIHVGKQIKKGEILGFAGNSGLSGEANGTDERIHLHFELWVDGEYLGKDLSPVQSKKLLELIFF